MEDERKVLGELQKAMGRLMHKPELCAGCRTCMAICSLSHKGVSSPELSGIQVMMMPREGAVVESNTCLQCENPECMSACPEKAIYIDGDTGVPVIDPAKCKGHRLCQKACPHQVSNYRYYGDGLCPIRYDVENNVCFKCDLCAGDPLCVKFCPSKALSLLEEEM